MLEFVQKDNEIVYGMPEVRRRFFDIACSLDSKIYYNNLRNYNRSLKQRNLQIKNDIESNSNDRQIWNQPLAKYGAVLTNARRKMISELITICNNKLSNISGQLELSMDYHSSLDLDYMEQSFIDSLEKSKKREDVFKSTVVGPHRDKILIKNKGRLMKKFSSQGEVRLAVLALKLALVEYLGINHNSYPLLLFDDILLEIDRKNLEALLNKFGENNQIFFTSTDVPSVEYFKNVEETFFFNISNGGVM